MQMRMHRPKVENYTHQGTMKRIVLQEFMGKKFLIEDSIKMAPWKLGTETKIVIGYLCRQASLYNEERQQNIIAWYTDKLRPFLGPENINTLPGAVLEININDGERIVSAKTIELRPLKKNELKVPTGGTKTSESEFRKMVDQHMERMRANGANVIIRN
jgi:GLPGLI family protein